MSSIKWSRFVPTGKGDSFGREDMGDFCEVNGALFVVPLFESAISKLSKSHLEAMIETESKNAQIGEVYELQAQGFLKDLSVDWHDKLKTSVISNS
jgi:hypothetical protein